MAIVVWLVLSIFVGMVGSDRRIGFLGAFCVSLIFSPLIGFIVVFTSKSNDAEKHEKAMLSAQKKQKEALDVISANTAPKISVSDELEKIAKLKESGVLSDEEYQKLKLKIIGE